MLEPDNQDWYGYAWGDTQDNGLDYTYSKAWTCDAWGDTRDKRVNGLKVSPEQKLRSYIVVADLGCALTPSAQPDDKDWSCYDWGCTRGKAWHLEGTTRRQMCDSIALFAFGTTR